MPRDKKSFRVSFWARGPQFRKPWPRQGTGRSRCVGGGGGFKRSDFYKSVTGTLGRNAVLLTGGSILRDLRVKKKKGKAVPLQAWSGPEGSRKLRFPDFVTAAQDGGKVASLTHRPPLTPRKCYWYLFPLEAESIPAPQCDRKDFISMKNSSDISWDRTSNLPICSTAP